MTRAADRTVASLFGGLVYCLVCLSVVSSAAHSPAHAQAAPAASPMPSPPNPPAWLETQPLPPTLLARARDWAMVDAAAPDGTLEADGDVLLVAGEWAELPSEILKSLKVRPDGDRLVIAVADSATLPAAMEAMIAGSDGIAVSVSGSAIGTIDGIVADLRKRDPDFLILLDLGAALPSPDTILPHGDGLIVRHVLADARGAPYPDDEAAARLAAFKALVGRKLPVLAAESAGDGASTGLKDRLTALGAIPFVSPVP